MPRRPSPHRSFRKGDAWNNRAFFRLLRKLGLKLGIGLVAPKVALDRAGEVDGLNEEVGTAYIAILLSRIP